MHLSCNFKSCFETVLNSREGTIQWSGFICLKDSYSLTSLFVGEFLWFFKRHKSTIFNPTVAVTVDSLVRAWVSTRLLKLAVMSEPGCQHTC